MNVLIIGDEGFARAIVGRWQQERTVPEIAVAQASRFKATPKADVAIVGPEALPALAPLLEKLTAAGAAILCVAGEPTRANAVREAFPATLVIRQHENWAEMAVLLAAEMLRRVEATRRAARAKAESAAVAEEAAIGRYMLEQRHSLNNALTSLLGNAELLLLDTGLKAEVRDQIQTVHGMAVRVYEVIQRLSSADTEIEVTKKPSHPEKKTGRALRATAP